jgi:hypothetical protein
MACVPTPVTHSWPSRAEGRSGAPQAESVAAQDAISRWVSPWQPLQAPVEIGRIISRAPFALRIPTRAPAGTGTEPVAQKFPESSEYVCTTTRPLLSMARRDRRTDADAVHLLSSPRTVNMEEAARTMMADLRRRWWPVQQQRWDGSWDTSGAGSSSPPMVSVRTLIN